LRPLCVVVCWAVACPAAVAVQSAPGDDARPEAAATLDPARIYRFDPLVETFAPIDRRDLKPGHVYHRYNPGLGRWVWSKANADKSLAYSMGPGSVQQVWLFDLALTAEERRREIEARAPREMAQLYRVQGARPAVRLEPDGRWVLHGVSNKGHVYDLETGSRWEWHGDRRVGVIHGGGNSWTWLDGRMVPAGMGLSSAFDLRGAAPWQTR
jgi:hypothetical protein